jgi:hypothetical protein
MKKYAQDFAYIFIRTAWFVVLTSIIWKDVTITNKIKEMDKGRDQIKEKGNEGRREDFII